MAMMVTKNSAFAQQALEQQPQPEEKIVYLTFDDGPTGPVTEEILNVLAKEDVKATFFVVGKEIIQREEVLKRIAAEGHGIGLHTYSHNLRKIYASDEAFLQELEQVKTKINEVLGKEQEWSIVRFPGGSSKRLTTRLLEELHEKGYRVYDWNVSLEDGVNPNLTPYQLFENAKKCSRNTTHKIILAHCNNNNQATAKALPQIIAYYREQGYRFDVIDEKAEEFYYKIKQ